MQNNNFEMTINNRKYWGAIIFYLLSLLIIVGYSRSFLFDFSHIVSNIKNSQWLFFIGFYAFSFSLLKEIVWLIAKVDVVINSEELIITKYFWGIAFVKKYTISKISNFIIKHGVPGNLIIGRDTGIPLIKERTVLYFNYEGKTKKIGIHLQDFPADSIINAVKKEAK
jgi:hypothetical protein